ncbi:MAG: DUF1450 domain-containing protein [Kyrpidia sp.]|nr:DUF1450 domain-containing protein [Kyrpidia sp.]
MLIVVEVCDLNPAAEMDWEELERACPGVSVLLHPCLSQCELCADHAYAFVDGEIVMAGTPEELMEAVRAKVDSAMKKWADSV